MIEVLSIMITAILTLLTVVIFFEKFREQLPIAHTIAIIGYPRSGKTTLITSLFAEIFAKRVNSRSLTLRGEETINKVNSDISKLEQGEELGKTKGSDIFSYRAELKTDGLLSRHFKIEIGDFPGEDSKEFTLDEINWLHETKYFKWVLSADSFVFVIDCEHVNSDESGQYRIMMTGAFRAAWHRIKDHHFDGSADLRRKRITLVFNKCDLLSDAVYEESGICTSVEHAYSDLVNFFDSESNLFRVAFCSSFVRDQNQARFGVKTVIRNAFPTGTVRYVSPVESTTS